MSGNFRFEQGCAARMKKAVLVRSEVPVARIYSANSGVFRKSPGQDVRNALIRWGG